MPLIELISEIAPRNYQNGNKFTILNTQYIEYAYNNTKTYDVGNVVLYNLGWYRCKVDGTVGVLPTVGANWDAIGGGGATLNNLGNVLFVSPTGNNTQNRATGIGQIDKPYTLAQAFAVCQNGDSIVIFSGFYNASYILGSSLTNVSLYLMDAQVTGSITFKNASNMDSFLVNIDGSQKAYINQLRTEDNLIDLKVKNIKVGTTVIDNIISSLDFDTVTHNSDVTFTPLATDCSFFCKNSKLNTLIRWQAANAQTIDIQGGAIWGILFFTGQIANFCIKDSKLSSPFAVSFDGSVTAMNISETFRIINVDHYQLAPTRVLLYVHTITSWLTPNKIKIINGSTNGSIYDAQPSMVSNIEYYNTVTY